MARATSRDLAQLLANQAAAKISLKTAASTTASAQNSKPERVLAIDPALRNTGWAILEKQGRETAAIAYGVISNPARMLQSGCLVAIREQLQDVIQKHRPSVCAIETTIFVQSYKTAIVLGTARAACLIAAAEHGLAIYEYAPREVKQAAVGRGAAQKNQVAFMIRSLLKLMETPPADAADALAVGITHLQNHEAASALGLETRRV
jgi:crossover junction endodeoxyribonuclease RuvC